MGTPFVGERLSGVEAAVGQLPQPALPFVKQRLKFTAGVDGDEPGTIAKSDHRARHRQQRLTAVRYPDHEASSAAICSSSSLPVSE